MINFKKIDFSSPAVQQRSMALTIFFFVILVIILVIVTPLISKAIDLNDTKTNLVFKLED